MKILASLGDELDAKIVALEKEIAKASAKNPMSRLLDEVPAIGPLISSAKKRLTEAIRYFSVSFSSLMVISFLGLVLTSKNLNVCR